MNHTTTNTGIKFRQIGFLVLLALGMLGVQHNADAQDEKLKFGAYGRGLQQTDRLKTADTLNVDHVNTGSVLMDLGFKITPDKRTEINAVIRLRSQLGSFYAAGDESILRWVYIRGVIAKAVNYELGDIRLQMSPYTMYNTESEGQINEASVFKNFRQDYVYYENFNKGNSWWQQGAHTDFTLGIKSGAIDQVKFDAFFVRNRTAAPAAFHTGGRVSFLKTSKFNFAVNYVNLYQIGATASDTASYVNNPVNTYELNMVLVDKSSMRLSLFGEGGFSQMNFYKDTAAPVNIQGAFGEGGIQLDHKTSGLTFKTSFRHVDAYFRSAGAQSKRVDYSSQIQMFPIYGNDPFAPNSRSLGLFDLVHDPTIMNRQIQGTTLMAYNPLLGNATPYGQATPNRQGIDANLSWKNKGESIRANAGGAFLQDVVAEGTLKDKRAFTVVTASADFMINKFIGWEKKMLLHGGIKMESTNRAGDTTQFVSLNTMLMDGGLEIEVLRKLDLLAGYKLLTAEGNEFLPVQNKYGEVTGWDVLSFKNISQSQALLGYGVKYNFSSVTYLTAQHHLYSLTDNTVKSRSVDFDRFSIMFNLSY